MTMKLQFLFKIFALLMLMASNAEAADDIPIADFEAETYGDWKVTGTAFGNGPAQGTLPGQMHVDGYTGKGLVNSFAGGDNSTGTLTSPELTIQRPYIRFLIGGGGHKGRTCMQLRVDGKTVRESTGANTQAGGSEDLEPAFWNVSEFNRKQATIVIIDDFQGGWGHINVDDIVQSDIKPQTLSFERSFVVEKDFLLIPIRNGAPKIQVEVTVDGKPVRLYETELATGPDQVDWYAYFTLAEYRGKSANLSVSRSNESAFALIRPADTIPAQAQNYDEALRPQLHFSQLVGWINDPNGMTYLDGEWHLYFQHNPVGWGWGNMTWGHAVSNDLIHWQQLPNALFPGTMAKGACFSGGAVIDKQNTAGWKKGDQDVLVAFLTDTGAGESVAFSHDRGRSFTWSEGNPVVKHQGRDPKVVWYAYKDAATPLNDEAKTLGGHWVMAVYDESDEFGQNTAFYTSTNLKEWTLQSHLKGYFECPEFFELPVTGTDGQSRWVTFAADGKYAVGQFDGKTFTPEHDGKHQLHHGKFYASQTFDSPPDDRRIQIGWMQIEYKGMPFNQTFTIPHQLTLKQTPDGVRMFAQPVQEIASLRTKEHTVTSKPLNNSESIVVPVSGELFDIEATFKPGDAKVVGLDIGGNRVAYNVVTEEWQSVRSKPNNGLVTVRVLLDRSQIEIWGNDGSIVIGDERRHRGNVEKITAFAEGGNATLVSLKAYELKSIWKK